MACKRILTIQDISCVGQCSMTVALPVLSAWGHETCVLPTALLSTHTGGFGTPEVIHFDEALQGFWKHWQQNHISFDAVLVGYLGSCSAVKIAEDIVDRLLAPGGICIVDPAMADHGKLYGGLDEDYAHAICSLCRRADYILPNMTEAALLTGTPWREDLDSVSIKALCTRMNHPCIILKGKRSSDSKYENFLWQKGQLSVFRHSAVPGSFSGTGDLFAACFTGALLLGIETGMAIDIAGRLTGLCVENTIRESAHWYGIRFETILPNITQISQNVLKSYK